MLQPLCLGPSKVVRSLQLVPPRIQPLIAAANRGDDVAPIVDAIAKSFGFDDFVYAVSLSPRPNTESRIYVYLTWPTERTRIYDERALVEVDPRVYDLSGKRRPAGMGSDHLSRPVECGRRFSRRPARLRPLERHRLSNS